MWSTIDRAMLPSKKSLEADPLIYPEDEDEVNKDELKTSQKRPRYNLLVLWTALSCLTVGIACAVAFSVLVRHDPKAHSACVNPPYRREWRTLSEEQQQDYLTAVLCLKDTPSRLGMNQSLWDDFPWVHALIGGYCAWLK